MVAAQRRLYLVRFERHLRNVVAPDELVDGVDKVVVQGAKQRTRQNRVTEIAVQEVAQAAGCLQLRHIGVQVQAVNAADLERHVVADNVSDVGRHRNLLPEIPLIVHLRKDAGLRTGPDIQTAAQGPPLKVRRSQNVGRLPRVITVSTNEHGSYASV